MRFTVICIFALVFLSVPVYAGTENAGRQTNGVEGDGGTYSIDKKSIERFGNEKFRVRVRLVFPDNGKSRVSEMSSTVEVDCNYFATRLVETKVLMRSGEWVAFQSAEDGTLKDEWKPFDEVEERVYLPHCI